MPNTVRFPGDIRLYPPDARGSWRVRGPGIDRRFRHRTDAEAAAWLAAGDGPQHTQPPAPTFGQVADDYLAGHGHGQPLAHHTVRTSRSTLNRHILPHLADLPVDKVTTADLKAVQAQARRAGLAPSTVDRIVRVCSAILQQARHAGHIDVNPCKGLIRSQPPALARQTLPTYDDIANLADAIVQVTGQPWRALQVWLPTYAGLRAGELLGLQADDLDLDAGTIHVRRQLAGPRLTPPKHGHVRHTIYPAWLDGPLAEHAKARPSGPLFPAASGGYEPYSTWLRQRLHPALQLAGWPRRPDGRWQWTAHTLRHYFGVWALSPKGLGLDIADVSMMMGHASPDITHRLYVSSRPDRFARARAASEAAAR